MALTAVIAWVFQGWLDVGIVSFRIVVIVGCLLGGVAAARRLAEERAAGDLEAIEEPVAAVKVVPLRPSEPAAASLATP